MGRSSHKVLWADFLLAIGSKVVWLASDEFATPDGFDERHALKLGYNRILGVDTRGSSICSTCDLRIWAPPEAAQASAICEMIFHLLTESFPRKVRFCGILDGIPLPVSGSALATFLRRHPNLWQVIFQFYSTFYQAKCNEKILGLRDNSVHPRVSDGHTTRSLCSLVD